MAAKHAKQITNENTHTPNSLMYLCLIKLCAYIKEGKSNSFALGVRLQFSGLQMEALGLESNSSANSLWAR